MIQRIQSIYLLLAGLFPAITFFLPILHFTGNNDQSLTMYSLGYDAVMYPEMAGVKLPALAVFTFIAILIPLFTIFVYKKRKLQIKLINITICSIIAWYVAFAAHVFSIVNEMNLSMSFDTCAVFPFLSIIALLMARRSIHKDEELIRAADRIR